MIKTKSISVFHLYSLKRGINEELKNVKYNDLEDMAFRLKVKFTGIADIPDTKYTGAKAKKLTLPPGITEISDL